MCVCARARACVYVCVCVYICVRACARARAFVCMCACVCACACAFVCVCVCVSYQLPEVMYCNKTCRNIDVCSGNIFDELRKHESVTRPESDSLTICPHSVCQPSSLIEFRCCIITIRVSLSHAVKIWYYVALVVEWQVNKLPERKRQWTIGDIFLTCARKYCQKHKTRQNRCSPGQIRSDHHQNTSPEHFAVLHTEKVWN